ncbi:MAG: hypothetical protein KDH15_17285 [Rhodocyclaceae bacterium]|nr:hypothetical protein [Rhodocyclaceae bacterium]
MDIADALLFIATGFAVVLGALALLWLISAATGRLFAATGAAVATPPAPGAPSASTASAGIPPPHLAAIAAAVAVVTAGRGRVVSVRAPAHLADAWASEGRADQLASHRLRWNWEAATTRPAEHSVTTAVGPGAAGDRKGKP